MKRLFTSVICIMMIAMLTLPTLAAENKIVYSQDFDSVSSFDQLGWEGSQYMQYNSELMKTMPVISSKGYYVIDGKFTSALDEKAQELFNRLQNVQYYIKKNYQVSD